MEGVLATAFNDSITGSGSNDVIIGGAGNDALAGGLGNDIYRFGLSDGSDTISDLSGGENIEITSAPSALGFARSGTDLVMNFDQTQVTFASFYSGNSQDSLFFAAGGTVFGGYALPTTAFTMVTGLSGGGGRDVVVGTTAGETITSGGSALDMIFAGGGGDTLNDVHGLIVAGSGNDTMTSTSGVSSDTYGFFIGDGTDTITDSGNASDTDTIWIATGGAELEVLSFSDSDTSATAGNLVVQYGATAAVDTITVNNHFGTTNADVERIGFDDGSFAGYELGNGLYTVSGVAAAGVNTVVVGDANGNALTGNTGNDLLFGAGGIDTLTGGLGRDLLVGGAGDDFFRFTTIGDSGTAAETADVIGDFVAGSDKIDLSLIGNVRVTFSEDVPHNRTIVEVHTGMDATPEMLIAVRGTGLALDPNRDFIMNLLVA
jgi:Ca2+-binding RTX toxin-like protein